MELRAPCNVCVRAGGWGWGKPPPARQTTDQPPLNPIPTVLQPPTADMEPPTAATADVSSRKYACILAFDVAVSKEARELAEEFGVKVFTADIIYHLFDQFTVGGWSFVASSA
jgi:hypothetical protein